jgi:hypothetical protein
VPYLATCIFLFFYNEPELGVGIDPGMAFTPLPSSIGQGSNPRPSDYEPSALPLDHSFCSLLPLLALSIYMQDTNRMYDLVDSENIFLIKENIVKMIYLLLSDEQGQQKTHKER